VLPCDTKMQHVILTYILVALFYLRYRVTTYSDNMERGVLIILVVGCLVAITTANWEISRCSLFSRLFFINEVHLFSKIY